MPLKYFRHIETGEIKKTLKGSPKPISEWEEVIQAPNSKFMVCANKATGKSKIKDQKKMLLERARNHSRDNDLDDNIAVNKAAGASEQQINVNFLNNGVRRKKIDDI